MDRSHLQNFHSLCAPVLCYRRLEQYVSAKLSRVRSRCTFFPLGCICIQRCDPAILICRSRVSRDSRERLAHPRSVYTRGIISYSLCTHSGIDIACAGASHRIEITRVKNAYALTPRCVSTPSAAFTSKAWSSFQILLPSFSLPFSPSLPLLTRGIYSRALSSIRTYHLPAAQTGKMHTDTHFTIYFLKNFSTHKGR